MSGWALNAADVGPLGAVLVALAALVGALTIHFLMRRFKRARETPGTPRYDENVSVEDAGLAATLRDLAGRMGLPERVLPRAYAPNGDGDFVWRDGDGWRYQSIERGGPVADHTGTQDEVLFAVFRDRTRMHAYLATIGMDEPAREAEIVKRQREMLAAGNPVWAERLRAGV